MTILVSWLHCKQMSLSLVNWSSSFSILLNVFRHSGHSLPQSTNLMSTHQSTMASLPVRQSSPTAGTSTLTETREEEQQRPSNSTLHLRLQKASGKKNKESRKVSWTQDTVDNEGLGRKKSKCCCVFHKPAKWGESDSESDGECDNCSGHVEAKKQSKWCLHTWRHHCDYNENCQYPRCFSASFNSTGGWTAVYAMGRQYTCRSCRLCLFLSIDDCIQW